MPAATRLLRRLAAGRLLGGAAAGAGLVRRLVLPREERRQVLRQLVCLRRDGLRTDEATVELAEDCVDDQADRRLHVLPAAVRPHSAGDRLARGAATCLGLALRLLQSDRDVLAVDPDCGGARNRSARACSAVSTSVFRTWTVAPVAARILRTRPSAASRLRSVPTQRSQVVRSRKRKSTVASWALLHGLWRRKSPPLRPILIAAVALIALGVLGTFPTFFQAFADE
jgi:hypothetical protein